MRLIGVIGLLWANAVVAETVTLFAAASLGGALQEAAGDSALKGVELRLALSGSSTAAKQIEAGAPADLFFSANDQWMDYLEARGLIEADSRTPLLGNALVLVVPRGERFVVEVRAGFDFPGTFNGRMALADPTHVPAGIYAREALKRLGWWDGVKNRLAPTKDVRAALALVERGACPVGVVYATDAPASPHVEVVAALPDSLHRAVVYPLATVKGKTTAATEAVTEYLKSDAAAAIFRRHGFSLIGR